MRLLFRTIKYRLKALVTGAHGIAFFLLALLVAGAPFIGLIIPDAPVPIGWIDEDNTEFSAMLLENVQELDVVWVTFGDRGDLIANLQTGRLEGVFVIKKGFEDAIKSGEFAETLQLLRSPYSTAAGVISESVGSEAMRLWLACHSANSARELGGDVLYQRVLNDALAGTDEPILRIERQNAAGQTGEVTPVLDAAYTSLYLLAALTAFFMLTGLAIKGREGDLALRLVSRGFSAERYMLAAGVADAIYLLPCAAVPLIAFGVAGAGRLIAPTLVLFLLYALCFGGIASLVSRLRDKTAAVMAVSVITIANVLLGSMLVKLPAAGAFSLVTYLLPARWLSSLDALGIWMCAAGLALYAALTNALPFIFRSRKV
ncbi:MAG: ABC transporter permease [Christensenellaceae bacterium]|nr:ABC transporter permease [Christensenellaceae bacterium]